jgi:hypothetical protein
MTDPKDGSIKFKDWLVKSLQKSSLGEPFCTNTYSCKKLMSKLNNNKLHCQKLKILHCAQLTGNYDFLIEIHCRDICTLEAFVNSCLKNRCEVSKSLKDTHTLVGVPIGITKSRSASRNNIEKKIKQSGESRKVNIESIVTGDTMENNIEVKAKAIKITKNRISEDT